MADDKIYVLAMIILLASCRPEGSLDVTPIERSKLLFRISKTNNQEAKCIRSLSVYLIDDQLNYSQDDKVLEYLNPNSRCVQRLLVGLVAAGHCDADSGCNYRAVSRNGIYVYNTDFKYNGASLQ